MEYLDIQTTFGDEIATIFEQPQFQTIPQVQYGFQSVKSIEKNGLLFVGLNPSRLKDNRLHGDAVFYTLQQKDNSYRRFWKPIEELATKMELNWSHIDLLYLRETQQKTVEQIAKNPLTRPFIEQQLAVTKKIIAAAQPKIIVVGNTLSRLFFGKMKTNNKNAWMNYPLTFNEDWGTDETIINHRPTPVFFTSMLSGRSALDLGSRERLAWHIKKLYHQL